LQTVTCRHCWATRALCAEPRASLWICCSGSAPRSPWAVCSVVWTLN